MTTKVLLTCRECGHQEWGVAEREYMNKIKMWNHVRKAHPGIEPGRVGLVMKVSFPYQYHEEYREREASELYEF